MFHYCYLIVNKLSGKIYIGSKSSEQKFDKTYFGSSLLLDKAIKKYGKKNFLSFPLKYYLDRSYAYKEEERYINIFDSLVPNGYNISSTGGFISPHFFSNKIKQYFSKLHKGVTWEQKFGKEEADKRKELYRLQRTGKTLKEILGEEGAKIRSEKISIALKGKKCSIETRQKISEKLKGKKIIDLLGEERTKIRNEKLSKSLKGKLKDRKLSLETRKKMSKFSLGRIPWNKGLKNIRKEKDGTVNF